MGKASSAREFVKRGYQKAAKAAQRDEQRRRLANAKRKEGGARDGNRYL